MCVSRWRIVTGREAGLTVYAPVFGSNDVMTDSVANAGKYFDAGSSRLTFFSSTSCIIATDVTALVIDAMRKTASAVIGRDGLPDATPAAPL